MRKQSKKNRRIAKVSARYAFIVSFLMAAVVGVSTAQAHGPTRQKVTQTVEINAKAADVWAVVGDFQNVSWRPDVEKSSGQGGGAVGAKRTLTFKSGGALDQAVTKLKDGQMIFYENTTTDVKALPVTNYSARITLDEKDGKTTVSWRAAFYRGYPNNDPPPELSDEAAKKAVTEVLTNGLASLKAAIEGSGS